MPVAVVNEDVPPPWATGVAAGEDFVTSLRAGTFDFRDTDAQDAGASPGRYYPVMRS